MSHFRYIETVVLFLVRVIRGPTVDKQIVLLLYVYKSYFLN